MASAAVTKEAAFGCHLEFCEFIEEELWSPIIFFFEKPVGMTPEGATLDERLSLELRWRSSSGCAVLRRFKTVKGIHTQI